MILHILIQSIYDFEGSEPIFDCLKSFLQESGGTEDIRYRFRLALTKNHEHSPLKSIFSKQVHIDPDKTNFGIISIPFDQTIYCPVYDKKAEALSGDYDCTVTKLKFELSLLIQNPSHSIADVEVQCGLCIVDCSVEEVASSKKLFLRDQFSDMLTGKLSVTTFYNKVPLQLSDRDELGAKEGEQFMMLNYQKTNFAAKERAKRKEYKFLLGRKLRNIEAGTNYTRPTHFDLNVEKSLSDDAKKLLSSKVLKEPKENSTDKSTLSKSSSLGANIKKQKLRNNPGKGLFNLRKTIYKVGYVHNNWPEYPFDLQLSKEKNMYRAILAKQGRFNLIQDVYNELMSKKREWKLPEKVSLVERRALEEEIKSIKLDLVLQQKEKKRMESFVAKETARRNKMKNSVEQRLIKTKKAAEKKASDFRCINKDIRQNEKQLQTVTDTKKKIRRKVAVNHSKISQVANDKKGRNSKELVKDTKQKENKITKKSKHSQVQTQNHNTDKKATRNKLLESKKIKRRKTKEEFAEKGKVSKVSRDTVTGNIIDDTSLHFIELSKKKLSKVLQNHYRRKSLANASRRDNELLINAGYGENFIIGMAKHNTNKPNTNSYPLETNFGKEKTIFNDVYVLQDGKNQIMREWLKAARQSVNKKRDEVIHKLNSYSNDPDENNDVGEITVQQNEINSPTLFSEDSQYLKTVKVLRSFVNPDTSVTYEDSGSSDSSDESTAQNNSEKIVPLNENIKSDKHNGLFSTFKIKESAELNIYNNIEKEIDIALNNDRYSEDDNEVFNAKDEKLLKNEQDTSRSSGGQISDSNCEGLFEDISSFDHELS